MPEPFLIAAAGALALLAAGWTWGHLRLRRRLVPLDACPKCGGAQWHRVHRHLAEHIFGLGLGVRRYRCANSDCGWEGVRRTYG